MLWNQRCVFSASIPACFWAIPQRDWSVWGTHSSNGGRRNGDASAIALDKLSLLFSRRFLNVLLSRRSGRFWRRSRLNGRNNNIDFGLVRRSKYNFHPGSGLKESNLNWSRPQSLNWQRELLLVCLSCHQFHLDSCPEWKDRGRGGLCDHSPQKNRIPEVDIRFLHFRLSPERDIHLKGSRDDPLVFSQGFSNKNPLAEFPILSVCTSSLLWWWGDLESSRRDRAIDRADRFDSEAWMEKKRWE